MNDAIPANPGTPVASPRAPAKWLPFAGALAVASAAAVFAWPSLNGDFLNGDDQRLIVDHALINHPTGENAWRLLTIVHDDLYQPLPMLSLQFDWAMAGPHQTGRYAVSAFSFHVTNLLFHVANSILAMLLAARISGCKRIGVLTGLMFACHPFAQEPVAWISGRMILMSTAFSLMFVLICVSRPLDGRGLWWVGAGLAWLAALASKVVPSVPVAVAFCDYQKNGRIPSRVWRAYAFYLLMGIAAGYFALKVSEDVGLIDAVKAEATTSTPVRLLLSAGYYLQSYVWPTSLAPWSPPPENMNMGSAETLLALSSCGVLIALMAVAWRTNRICFIGLMLFVLLMSPYLVASTARRFLAADRYMYLPIFGLHLALAAALVAIFDRLRRANANFASAVTGVPIAVILTVWMILAWRTAPTWADTIRWNERVVFVYPNSVTAWAEMAKAYLYEGQPDKALEVVAKAEKRWPDNPRLACAAGEAFRQKNELLKALPLLAKACEGMPTYLRSLYFYARTLDDLGRSDEAADAYQRMLAIRNDYLPAVSALANRAQKAGRTAEALQYLLRALEINLFDRDSRTALASLLITFGKLEEAENHLRILLKIDPKDVPARLNLAVVLANTNRTDDAMGIYNELISENGGNITARVNRAALFAAQKKLDEAERDYRFVLSSHPGSRAALIGLHELLQQSERFSELEAVWSAATGTADELLVQSWGSWARVLDGKGSMLAEQLVDKLPPNNPRRAFVLWGVAFDALRAGDEKRFRNFVPTSFAQPSDFPERLDESRVVQEALATLPESIRNSPAGYYALAASLLFSGNIEDARTAAKLLASRSDAGDWANDANSLLVKMDMQTTTGKAD